MNSSTRLLVRVLMVIPALFLGVLIAPFGAFLVSGAGDTAVRATVALLPPFVAFAILLPAEKPRTAALLPTVAWAFVYAALAWADGRTGGVRRLGPSELVPIAAATLLGAIGAASAARALDQRDSAKKPASQQASELHD